MREIRVEPHGNIPQDRLDAVMPILRRHGTLPDILDWCVAQAPPRDLAEVVVQDEYTHDVVLDLGGGLFAVYDTT